MIALAKTATLIAAPFLKAGVLDNQDISDEAFFYFHLVALSLVISLLICLIVFLTFLIKPARQYLKKHDANVRYCCYDVKKGKVYSFDSRNFALNKTIGVGEFTKQFGKDATDGGESRRIRAWLDKAAKNDLSEPLYQTKIYFSNRRTRTDTILKITKVNEAQERVHFESRLLPNTTLAKRKRHGRNARHFMVYADYLQYFRGLLSKKRQATFFNISLQPDPQAVRFLADSPANNYVTVLLADAIARHIGRKRYVIVVDNFSLMLVNLRPLTHIAAEQMAYDLHKETLRLLKINSIEDRYAVKVGIAIHNANKPVLTLREYVDQSRKAGEMSGTGKNFRAVIYDTQSPVAINHLTPHDLVELAVTKEMWRLYYTPTFRLDSGAPVFYKLNIVPYGESFKDEDSEFLADVWRNDLLAELTGKLDEQIEARAALTTRRKAILFPIKVAYLNEIEKALKRSQPEKVDIIYGFKERDIARYEGPQLEKILKRLQTRNIACFLFVKGTVGGVIASTMALFQGIILEKSEEDFWTPEERIKTLVALNILQRYHKPIALAGLLGEDECLFAIASGVVAAASDALCRPSSYLEVLDLSGRSLIERLNTNPSATSTK